MPLNVTKSVCNAYFSVKVSKDIKKNGRCLACVYRVMDARGKLGEQGRSVWVARGEACRKSICFILDKMLYMITRFILITKQLILCG